MEVIELEGNYKSGTFNVNKLIKNGSEYFAEIKPFKDPVRVKIKGFDYFKALNASENSYTVLCYPLGFNENQPGFQSEDYILDIRERS